MSDWVSCDEVDLCDEGYVCDDDFYGNCQERFPMVFWIFQLIFAILFISQCVWACCDHQKRTAEKTKPSKQQSVATKVPQTPVTPVPNGNNAQLPEGWVQIATPEGKVYYQNNKTKQTQWERPVIIVASNTSNTNTNPTANAEGFDWESFDYSFGAFVEFPFSTTCRNYLIRLLCCAAAMTAFLFARLMPSCCPDFYDANWEVDCCSWAGTNYAIYIFSWIMFVWYCLSGLYCVFVKKAEMTWVSSSTHTQGNYDVTTTTVSTSSNVIINAVMLTVQAGMLCLAMAILPAILGSDCVNYYC